ncbi:type VII secretion protein EccB [Amycolatopsis sp. H20-H5]|uniref:type VII secretion protein EccB n=1 Tax=Amycolatopsis sp. H20-H5 TaxID=3046309 RepID=UPI002DB9DC6A|nr:type VII secretion protein EccB [Amycolatopsis sp. H20-H5]MEC3980609.1 type VII secretion protein EccB [Amycolatopsis sp. H20-H5]
MQTQKDRVDAYNFMMGRMSTALVLADPTSGEVPARRARLGLILGLVLALLITVGFGVYGLIVPGGSKVWQQKGAILVEKETGTRFVYLGGVLRPTRNQASALLVQGKDSKVEMISRSSLAGLVHGGPIGIDGAPDVVPAPGALTAGPWFVCLPQSGVQNGQPSMTVLLDPAARMHAPGAGEYLVLASPAGEQYLVWHGQKFRLADPTVPVALGVDNLRPIAAPQVWLGSVPDGPTLAAADIEDAGKPGPDVSGERRKVGQLVRQRAANGAEQLYVVRKDGLAPMTATEFGLLSVRPGAAAPVDVSPQAVAAAPRSADTTLMNRLPDLAHATATVTGSSTVCVRQRPSGATVVGAVVLVEAAVPASEEPGTVRALVKPGSGMLVASVPAPPGARVPDRFLITDQGIRYPLADNATIEALGFSGVAPVPMAGELLSALPGGPALSRAAAVA